MYYFIFMQIYSTQTLDIMDMLDLFLAITVNITFFKEAWIELKVSLKSNYFELSIVSSL